MFTHGHDSGVPEKLKEAHMPGLTILLIPQLPMSEQVSVYSLCKAEGFRIIGRTHTHTHDRMRGNGHTGEEQGTSSTAFGDNTLQ